MTLDEFLLARIAEDEEAARSASRRRTVTSGDRWEVASGAYLDSVLSVGGAGSDATRRVAQAHVGARHIARHDPARVLAECEAKRALVKVHRPHMVEWDEVATFSRGYECLCCGGFWLHAEEVTCYSLRILALPYADRPDYREEWRP